MPLAMPRAKSKVFVLGNFVQACCWMVPRLPLPGETLIATGVNIEAGGKGLNVAVCLQRLGLQVDALIGCGADSAASYLLALLEREGISKQHVHAFEGASGWGSGWIAADGQNAIAVFPGANLLLNSEHVAQAQYAISQSQLVYGQFETSLQAVDAAFAIAHKSGVPTVLNPSPWQMPSAAVLSTTHTVIVNETEARQLLALPAPLLGDAEQCAMQVNAALENFWGSWPASQRLIVTLGALGSLGFERSAEKHTYQAAPKIQAIDTVGAGDAFASGYCAAVLAGHDLQTALLWGNACGAHLASIAGVLDALPHRVVLERLLKE